MLFGACRFVRLHRTSEHDMRRNLCRTISLGHWGDVLQRLPGLIVLVLEGMATNQGSDAIPLMGHIALRAYLGSHRRSARNYTRRQWRVVAQCVNNLHISVQGACLLHISSKEIGTMTVLSRRNVYYPLISHPQVLPRMLSSGT
jgi:hypothetical protein